ncbi:MAG: hypothetical protein KBH15_00440 [Candidatus Atribacteria bacterium]|nr:hypothetical protein [Candidatus Atribacteria bacterium]
MKKEDSFLEITYLDLKEYQAGKIGDKEKEEEKWLEEGRERLRGKRKEPKRINVASLGVLTRKIMAQEWAKIKGRKLSPIYIRALEEEIRQRREKI